VSSSAPPAAPEAAEPPPSSRIPGLPGTVLALGVVSLLTDFSTAMIVPVLPLFVTAVLGGSAASVGLIEGVAESSASLFRIFSGFVSDRSGQRKPFILFGYGVSTVAKAVMGLAPTWATVLGLRFADRVGKGLRNPPRDALIADSVEPRYFGRAFGFHRALDTLGSALGPLAAYAMLGLFPGDYRRVFLASAIPGVASVLVLAAFVRGRARKGAEPERPSGNWRALGTPFFRFVTVAGVFALASSSIAMLLLLGRRVGLSERDVALVYLLYNVVFAALSWPLGELTDRIGRRPLLIGGYLLFAAIYGMLAWRQSIAFVVAGFVLLGIQYAMWEGTEKSLLADLLPKAMRGTGYGVYYTVVGVALLPASALAGVLWDRFGPRTMLAADAALALIAAILFVLWVPLGRKHEDRTHAAA
jgi:MFS family permease